MSAKGVYKWSAIDRVCNSVITFTGNIVMARLLTPDDFGLLAMVAIFTAIAYNLSGCGMSDGLIHKAKPTERDYSTVFVFNGAFGLFFAIVFSAAAHPLSLFFERPQIEGIMYAIAVCFFFQTLSFTQETRMRKNLDMKRMCIVRLSATITSLVVGIVLILMGYGYWGLVSTHIFLSFFLFVYYVTISRWMPRIAFYRDSFKEMFGYGIHLMIAFVTVQIGRNINTMVLGKFISPASSGIYSQGQKLEEVPYAITESVFNWPFFAVLSNEQNHTKRQQLCRDMHVRLWILNIAVGAFLLLVSWPAFNVLYGSKWDAAVPVFRILIAYGIASSMKFFYQSAMKAYNRTKLMRNLTVIEVGLQLALLAIFFRHGIEMVALTQVIAAIIICIAHAWYYKKIMGFTVRQMLGEFVHSAYIPTIAFAGSAALATLWYNTLHPVANCALLCIAFAAAYIGICAIVRPPYYTAAFDMIKAKLYRRNRTNNNIQA